MRSFGQAVSEEKYFKKSTRKRNCLLRPWLFPEQNVMWNIYGGPSKDASYEVSINFAKQFQKKRIL